MKSRLFVPLLFFLTACASDKYVTSTGHALFQRRDWEKAAAAFEKEAALPGANQVLFLMDQGSALFAAQKYEEATRVFLKAEKLSEIKDYTSISEEVGTLATSDNVRGYKGEDFEKILINVYLAMAYAAMDKYDDAQVEARKINQTLYKMIHEGKRNYEESPFARYFAAMMWESDGSYSDAYIDYKKAYELDPRFPELGRDLISNAHKLGMKDQEQEWKAKFPELVATGAQPGNALARMGPFEGELVAIFEKGSGPVKVPRNGRDSNLPRYMSRYSHSAGARVTVNGQAMGTFIPALDIVRLSTRYLEDRIGRMVAAKLAGAAVKGALAASLGHLTKDENLGWLAFYVLMATDRADLRCWRSLPAELNIARIPLKAGKYDVKMEVLGWSGEVIATLDYPQLEIKAGKKRVIAGR